MSCQDLGSLKILTGWVPPLPLPVAFDGGVRGPGGSMGPLPPLRCLPIAVPVRGGMEVRWWGPSWRK